MRYGVDSAGVVALLSAALLSAVLSLVAAAGSVCSAAAGWGSGLVAAGVLLDEAGDALLAGVMAAAPPGSRGDSMVMLSRLPTPVSGSA